MAVEAAEHAKGILMNDGDNVVTVLANAEPGTTVIFETKEGKRSQKIIEAIPFGHKIAVKAITQGEEIRKYGESIGAATRDIKPGEHVHVHNIESCRARGDKN